MKNNLKTIFFVGLVAAVMISLGGINAVAAQVPTGENIGFKYSNIQTGSSISSSVPGVPAPNSGTINCVSYVTIASPCTGLGTGLGSGITVNYPSTSYFYTHMCNDGTVPCVSLKWQATGYPNSIYDPNANDTFFWHSGSVYSCSTSWGCTNTGYWVTPNNSPHIMVRDAPTFDPITTHSTFNYKSSSGQWAQVTIVQDLALGFG